MSIDGSLQRQEGSHGGLSTDFAELRRLLANPSELTDEHRQRLQRLARKVTRIRAFGGGRLRVEVSEYVTQQLPAGVVA